MSQDYTNKHFVCPVCRKQDIIYIDLNQIRSDNRVESGLARQTIHHGDHVLLLDIDHYGDVRTIVQQDPKLNLSYTRPTLSDIGKIKEWIYSGKSISVWSTDLVFAEVIGVLKDECMNNENHFKITQDSQVTIFSLKNGKFYWYRTPVVADLNQESFVYIIDVMGQEIYYLPKEFEKLEEARIIVFTEESLLEGQTDIIQKLQRKNEVLEMIVNNENKLSSLNLLSFTKIG